jgi:hypothetical protein
MLRLQHAEAPQLAQVLQLQQLAWWCGAWQVWLRCAQAYLLFCVSSFDD